MLWRNLIPAVSMTNEKGFWGRDNCHGYHVANRNFYSSLLFTDEINPKLRLIWLSWKLQASLPCEMCFCLLLLYKYLECALSIMSVSILLNLVSREIDLLLSNSFSPLPTPMHICILNLEDTVVILIRSEVHKLHICPLQCNVLTDSMILFKGSLD